MANRSHSELGVNVGGGVVGSSPGHFDNGMMIFMACVSWGLKIRFL